MESRTLPPSTLQFLSPELTATNPILRFSQDFSPKHTHTDVLLECIQRGPGLHSVMHQGLLSNVKYFGKEAQAPAGPQGSELCDFSREEEWAGEGCTASRRGEMEQALDNCC